MIAVIACCVAIVAVALALLAADRARYWRRQAERNWRARIHEKSRRIGVESTLILARDEIAVLKDKLAAGGRQRAENRRGQVRAMKDRLDRERAA